MILGEPGPAPRPGAWGGALQGLLGVAAVLAIGELVVRTWIESPSTAISHPRYGFVEPAHARVVHSSEGWSVHHTNALGLFDDELLPHPAHRALLLGDSYSEALQVPVALNFQSVAEHALPGWEIVNAGMSGRNPIQYADWIEEFGDRLPANVIVVQINDGDLDDLTQALAHPDTRGMSGTGAEDRGLRLAARDLLRRSALATLISRRLQLLSGYERERLAHRLTRGSSRGPAAVDGVPLDPGLGPLLDGIARRIQARGRPVVWVYVPGIDYFAEPCAPRHPDRRAFYRAFVQRNHLRWVDPTDAFCEAFRRTGQPVHGFANSVMGSGHINAAGHAIVGRELADAIRALPR